MACGARLLPFLVLILASLGPRQDDVAAQLRTAFRPAKRPEAVQGQRMRALAAAEGQGTPKVAEALIDAYATVADELASLEDRHRKFVLRGTRDMVQDARPGIDPLRALLARILGRIRELDEPVTVTVVVERALKEKKLPLQVRLSAARRAGVIAGIAEPSVVKALGKGRKPPELLVSLVTARNLGSSARPFAKRAAKLLDHDDAVIRETAANALTAMAAPEGIAPIVMRLRKETGRTRERMIAALQVLTGERIATVGGWEQWLEQEGQAFIEGLHPLGEGQLVEASAAVAHQYHGLPIDGESVLFLLDASRSMRRTMTTPSEIAQDSTKSRNARAREELIRALEELPESKRFDIIAFGGVLERFADGPVPATEENVRRAVAWIRYLELNFGTRIHDALELAFAEAGMDATAGYYDAGIDTIFLLTDGQPYVGRRPDDKEANLRAIRRWNLMRRVVIHTIGLGDEVPQAFLERIASENGGQFVHEVSGER